MMTITIVARNKLSESRYTLDIEPFRTVLDALEMIRAASDPGLVYRHSCHHGSCGTCGAIVNGKPRLMCVTRIDSMEAKEILVEPLKKATLLNGIAVWPGRFFLDLPDTSYLKSTTSQQSARYVGSTRDWIKCGFHTLSLFIQFEKRHSKLRGMKPACESLRLEDCIECGICVDACPVGEEFVGPAALAATAIELEKNPLRRVEMLNFSSKPNGVAKCERFFECSKACPRGVSPGRRITELLALLGKRN
jgi:succinate dehydrogenase / fumarate reductase iron-sulfur subunit